MSAHTSRSRSLRLLVASAFLVPSLTLFADTVLQKVPPLTVDEAPSYLQNVARYNLGAQLEATPRSNSIEGVQLSVNSDDRNTSEAALLCDDPTVGYRLPNGSTTLVISLSKIENVDSVSFFNHGAKGEVAVAVSGVKLSPGSRQWRDVAREQLASDVVKAKIGPSDAKYVRLTFNVTDAGRIAGLGVYPTAAVADFTMPRVRKQIEDKSDTLALISCSLSELHSRARALYVSSGADLKQANNMIDNQPATAYTFNADDAAPTAIIDLGKDTSVRRISTIYRAQEGMIDFYVLQSLPGVQGDRALAPKNVRFSDKAFADLKPVGSIADTGTGRAAIDFAPVTGRYVMIKWSPAAHQDAAFSVAEIAAFGRIDESKSLIAANISAVTDGKDAKDLGEGKDAKEMPEEGPPAEGPPPGLPEPPPFQFAPQIVPQGVPQIIPTSP